MPRELAMALGQVMPDRPNSRTSHSRIPLHIQTNIARLLVFGLVYYDIDNRSHF
jgi:hypothetical protein